MDSAFTDSETARASRLCHDLQPCVAAGVVLAGPAQHPGCLMGPVRHCRRRPDAALVRSP